MDVNGVAAANNTFEFTAQKADTVDHSSDKAASIEKRGVDSTKYADEITAVDSEVTSEFIQKTIDRVNKQLRGSELEFNHSVHEKTGQFMVKIIDRETKAVIREIPPEKTLDAVAKMWELTGIFVDRKK